jgi:hypothetical protein
VLVGIEAKGVVEMNPYVDNVNLYCLWELLNRGKISTDWQ